MYQPSVMVFMETQTNIVQQGRKMIFGAGGRIGALGGGFKRGYVYVYVQFFYICMCSEIKIVTLNFYKEGKVDLKCPK